MMHVLIWLDLSIVFIDTWLCILVHAVAAFIFTYSMQWIVLLHEAFSEYKDKHDTILSWDLSTCACQAVQMAL